MKKKICLVTTEIPRPQTWDGSGAHFSALSIALAADGHDVSIALVDFKFELSEDFERFHTFYRDRGVKLFRPALDYTFIETFYHAARSFSVFQWLRAQEFDVVHFLRRFGLGYYSLLANHQGLAFESTELVVNMLGSLEQIKRTGDEVFTSEDDLVVDFLERECCRLAPVRVTATDSERAIAEKEFPSGRTVHLPLLASAEETDLPEGLRTPDSLVYCGFVGRCEDLTRFCDAVDAVPADLIAGMPVVFMGPSSPGDDIYGYLAKRASKWKAEIKVVSIDEGLAALYFLQKSSRLSVLFPSLGNLGAMVPYFLMRGMTFVAPREARFIELVEEPSGVFFDSTSDSLCSAMEGQLKTPLHPKTKVDQKTIAKRWIDFHRESVDTSARTGGSLPFISVCLVHCDRPGYLKEALASLEAQTYRNFEVIVVDNDSKSSEILEVLEKSPSPYSFVTKVIRSRQDYPGVARNFAAKSAKGSHLLFMDDDNLAKPTELAVFAKAAAFSNSDILTCAHSKFIGSDPNHLAFHWLPIGPLLSLGVRYNVFGDTNFLVKREVFLSLGGFANRIFYGEDWEFLSRAIFAGHRMEVVPEILYLYREHSENLTKGLPPVSRSRLAPYLDANHPAMAPMLMVSAHESRSPSLSIDADRQTRIERGSTFYDPEKICSVVSEVRDLELVRRGPSLMLTRAGSDPQMIIDIPKQFDGPLELEFWMASATSVVLKVYWMTESLPYYNESNTAVVHPSGTLKRTIISISDERRFGALRFDLEGEGSVIDLHGVRINSVRKKDDTEEKRKLRTIQDLSNVLEDGAIYFNGVAMDWDKIHPTFCSINRDRGRIEVVAENDDPQIDLSYAFKTNSQNLVIVVETESSPVGKFKVFWNLPYAIFSEDRAVDFPLDPKGTTHVLTVSAQQPISGMRLDPNDVAGTTVIRKISISTPDFLEQAK